MKLANIRELFKRKQTQGDSCITEDSKEAWIRGLVQFSLVVIAFFAMILVMTVTMLLSNTNPISESEYLIDGTNLTDTTTSLNEIQPVMLTYETTCVTTTQTSTVETTSTTTTTTMIITTAIETTTVVPIVTTVATVTTEVATEPVASVDTSNMRYLGNMRTTGYLATGHCTASGEVPYVGGVAMNRSYGLPWGTRIYIEGFGYYTVNDTGCRTGIVDIFCNTLQDCRNVTTYRDVWVVNE